MAELDGAFFIERMKDLYGKMAKAEGKVEAVCEQCGEGKSVAFCRQCTEFICEDCTRSHEKMKSFSGHEVASLADLKRGGARGILLKEAPLPKCSEHDEIMKIFCFDCNCLVCRDCVLYDHREHKSDFVKKCAAERRNILRESLAPLQKIQADIKGAIKVVLSEKNLVTSQNEAVCATIQQSFDKLKEILDQRKADLLEKASMLAQSKVDVLTVQVSGLKAAEVDIDGLVGLIELKIENTSDQDLVDTCSQLQAKLKEEEKRHNELDLAPITTANVACKPPPLDVIPKELGAVFVENCASSLTVHPPKELSVGEPTHLVVPQEMVHNVQVQLISLVDPNCIVNGSVGITNNAVTFTPRVRGRHHLVVKVDTVSISGSPFLVFVKICPTQLGKPVHVIGGFNRPWGIAISNRQQLVVAEIGGRKVTVMEKNGRRIREICCDKLRSPVGVATSPDDVIYVTDDQVKCLFRFSHNGDLQFQSKKCFTAPYFVRVINGQVYISDKLEHKIIVMDLQCKILGSIVTPDRRCIKDIIEHKGDLYVGSDGQKGIGIYQCKPGGVLLRNYSCNKGLVYHRGIGFDKNGYLYVVCPEWGSEGVYVFNSAGNCIKSLGVGLLRSPAGLVIDEDGFVYVCDYTSDCDDASVGKVYVF